MKNSISEATLKNNFALDHKELKNNMDGNMNNKRYLISDSVLTI